MVRKVVRVFGPSWVCGWALKALLYLRLANTWQALPVPGCLLLL